MTKFWVVCLLLGLFACGRVGYENVATSACLVNADCPEACVDSICAPYSTSGGNCDEPEDCEAGLECTAGVCTGTGCTSNDDCLDVCMEGECGSSFVCTGPGNTLKRDDIFGDSSTIVTYLFDHGTKSLRQETGSYGVYDAQPVGAPSIVAGHSSNAVLLNDGDALAFDAVPLPYGASPRAFSLWLKLEAQPVGRAGILTYGSDSGAPNEFFSLSILASGELAVDTQGTVIGSGYFPLVSLWVHLAVSYDGVNLSIFVNGEPAVESPIALITGTDTNGKRLGDYDGSHPLSGAIDHLRVFNRALLAAEIITVSGECDLPDPLVGDTFSTLVFEDDFGGDLSEWSTWGSPLPRILPDAEAGNGLAFDTNGDPNWHSGGDTLFSVDYAQSFAVEFRAKQLEDLNTSNKWFYLDLGLTQTQSSGNGTGARANFRISGIRDTNKFELFSPFALCAYSPGNSPVYLDNWNDWQYHVYRIETVLVDGMRHFRFFVDGVLLDRSAWEDLSVEPWYVTLQGRSSGFDHYVDWIRIYTP